MKKKAQHTKAVELRQRWQTGKRNVGSAAGQERVFTRPTPRIDTVTILGTVDRIDYTSNKYGGKKKGYFHDFRRKHFLAASADGDAILIFPATPRRIVTERGIVG